MLSTPAMNVVATAPSPGVRMPSLPVAGRGVVACVRSGTLHDLFSFEQWARRAVRAQNRGRASVSGARFRFFRSRGGRVHVGHALDHGDPGRDGQNDDDDGEHPPVEHQAEEGLRRRQENHALGPLQQPDLGIESERLGARARVRREKRADETEQTRVIMSGMLPCIRLVA